MVAALQRSRATTRAPTRWSLSTRASSPSPAAPPHCAARSRASPARLVKTRSLGAARLRAPRRLRARAPRPLRPRAATTSRTWMRRWRSCRRSTPRSPPASSAGRRRGSSVAWQRRRTRRAGSRPRAGSRRRRSRARCGPVDVGSLEAARRIAPDDEPGEREALRVRAPRRVLAKWGRREAHAALRGGRVAAGGDLRRAGGGRGAVGDPARCGCRGGACRSRCAPRGEARDPELGAEGAHAGRAGPGLALRRGAHGRPRRCGVRASSTRGSAGRPRSSGACSRASGRCCSRSRRRAAARVRLPQPRRLRARAARACRRARRGRCSASSAPARARAGARRRPGARAASPGRRRRRSCRSCSRPARSPCTRPGSRARRGDGAPSRGRRGPCARVGRVRSRAPARAPHGCADRCANPRAPKRTRPGSRTCPRTSAGCSAPVSARSQRRLDASPAPRSRRCSITASPPGARGPGACRRASRVRARRLALHGAGLHVAAEPPRASRGVPLGGRRRRGREPDDALRLPPPARRARGGDSHLGLRAGRARVRAAARALQLRRSFATTTCSPASGQSVGGVPCRSLRRAVACPRGRSGTRRARLDQPATRSGAARSDAAERLAGAAALPERLEARERFRAIHAPRR